MKKKYVFLAMVFTVVGFIVFQSIRLRVLLVQGNIFGIQETASSASKQQSKQTKSEELRSVLKQGTSNGLKSKARIKKENPFYSFTEETNTKLAVKTNKPKKIVKPKQRASKKEEQYFFSVKGDTAEKAFYSSVTRFDQKVKEGKQVALFLNENIPDLNIKVNSKLLGIPSIVNNRLHIKVTSFILNKKPMPVTANLICYDADFVEGIFFDEETLEKEGNMKDEVVNDLLSSFNSKAVDLTRKYIDKSNNRQTLNITIPKGKEIFLSISKEEEY